MNRNFRKSTSFTPYSKERQTMYSGDIQRFNKVSTAKLADRAQTHFNRHIRERDSHLPCINCGNFCTKKNPMQAGHFYPVSTHPWLRFDPDNVHGECLRCNFYDSQSHAFGYRPNLIKKIGQEAFDALELRAQTRNSIKNDRFAYIEIILQYGRKRIR